MTDVFIRLFIAATAPQALIVADRLMQRLQPSAARESITVVRAYWKIPEYQEVCLRISMFEEPRQALMTLATKLGTGWWMPHATEAIWNPGEESTFEEPLVRWAHIEVEP